MTRNCIDETLSGLASNTIGCENPPSGGHYFPRFCMLAAAASISAGRRGAWLQDVANRLEANPSDDELRRVLGLVQDDAQG